MVVGLDAQQSYMKTKSSHEGDKTNKTNRNKTSHEKRDTKKRKRNIKHSKDISNTQTKSQNKSQNNNNQNKFIPNNNHTNLVEKVASSFSAITQNSNQQSAMKETSKETPKEIISKTAKTLNNQDQNPKTINGKQLWSCTLSILLN